MIPITPWVDRKFDFNFPVGIFPIILERLRGTIPRLRALIDGVSDEQVSKKQNDKWSVKEVIGHLSDLEDLWMGRIDDFLEGKETLRAADMTNTKTHEAGHNQKPVEELLRQFADRRQQLLSRVHNIDERTASRVALHPRLQKNMRLIDSLFFAAEHDDHELCKIRGLLNSD
jgi:uncharacterized damage-inducible protein DinB